MFYLAHAATVLVSDFPIYEKNKWFKLKPSNELEYKWRITSNKIYEVICGPFNDPLEAQNMAKNLHKELKYNFLFNDIQVEGLGYSFDQPSIWTHHHIGGRLGANVFEIIESIDELDETYFNKRLSGYLTPLEFHSLLDFNNYGSLCFLYNDEAARLLDMMERASGSVDSGLKMTIYCGILENLTNDAEKSEDVLLLIDALIKEVGDACISEEEKKSLIGYLKTGKRKSSREKCIDLCKRYATGSYGQYSAEAVVKAAYKIRSSFSHGSNRYSTLTNSKACYMEKVVKKVIAGYLEEKYY